VDIGYTHVYAAGRRHRYPCPRSLDLPSWDLTRLDELVPHPVYAWMSWVQILSPTPNHLRVAAAAARKVTRSREAKVGSTEGVAAGQRIPADTGSTSSMIDPARFSS
jgi:hypothetical protein